MCFKLSQGDTVELFPCLLCAKQNRTKEMKETRKSSANTGRQSELCKSSGYLKGLNAQNIRYLMLFSSCSEKRCSVICLENC